MSSDDEQTRALLLSGLVIPSPAARQRAEQIVPSPTPLPAQAPAPPANVPLESDANARAYPIALALCGLSEAPGGVVQSPPARRRPPPFAPAIRPSPPPKKGAAAIEQDVLEKTAQTALLLANPDGSTFFHAAVDNALFEKLHFKVDVIDQKIAATFYVTDANLRRLLEAEKGRLRMALTERGLKVEAISVVLDDSNDDL